MSRDPHIARRRTWAILVGVAAVIAVTIAVISSGANFGSEVALHSAIYGPSGVPAGATKPNIVIILTDDQPKGQMDALPVVEKEIAGKGTTYSNAVIPNSVCCPSRTSLLTGTYSPENGVWGNRPSTYGGYPVAKANGVEKDTLATRLSDEGYETGLFGKYLNRYQPKTGAKKPPGWTTWNAFAEHGNAGYQDFHYTNSFVPDGSDEERIRIDHVPTEYSTTFMGDRTLDFIRNAPADKPIFALYAPITPHDPATPEKKYEGTALSSDWMKTDPAINETDLSDKPRWVAQLKPRTPNPALWEHQTEALRTINDQVEKIIATLRETNRLSNTLLVFTSDNGLIHGQHGLQKKSAPYRAATDVDLMVRYGDGLTTPVVDPCIVTANVDLAATVVTAAGLPNSTSGVPLGSECTRPGVPVDGTWNGEFGHKRPPYCGWRTADSLFTRYGSGEEEYYDYKSDPYELSNQINNPAYRDQIAASRDAARSACDPPSPDYGPDFDTPTWKYDD